MSWIESHQSIGRHPKLNKLRSLSGWSKHEAIGVLHDLWHWVLTYAEDGDISRFTSEEIALGIDIDPAKFDVKNFVRILIEAGFVRKDLKIHDWMDYAGKYLTSKYRNHNPKKLLEIQKKYASKNRAHQGRTKGALRAQMDEAPTYIPNQDNQDNIYTPAESIILFESIWQKYPSKDGRKDAEKHFKATVKTDQDLDAINKALTNYLGHLKVNDWKKPKNGSTWFNNWRDWINWIEPKKVEPSKPGNGVVF